MATVPVDATFQLGFTIPEWFPYGSLSRTERAAKRDALQEAGRGFNTLPPGLATRPIDVDSPSGHASDGDLRAHLDTHLMLISGGGPYTAGGPSEPGVIYVWRNGAWVCIHCFSLLEKDVDGNVQLVSHTVATSLGPLSAEYFVSLEWSNPGAA